MGINLANFFSPINRYTVGGFLLLILGFFLMPLFFVGLPVMVLGTMMLMYGFYDFALNLFPGGRKLKQTINQHLKSCLDWYRTLWKEAMKP